MSTSASTPLPRAEQPAARVAIYPGSFDPITLGHLDIIRRASALFDEVIVGIAHNAAKQGRHLLDIDTRVELARQSLGGIPGARVELIPGLLADYCHEHGVSAIIKGLRNGSDFDAESPMAHMNRRLGAPDTVFFIAAPHLAHISSSLVKDVASYGRDVSELVPGPVAAELSRRFPASASLPHMPQPERTAR